MMNALKICFVSSEVTPFARTGGLGDVSAALPAAIKALEQDVRIIMPKYRVTNERKFVLREVIRLREVEITLNDKTLVANGKTAFLPNSKVHVYFMSISDLFEHKELYVNPETGEPFPDNAQRFAYFSKGILETLKRLYWQPDVIHCNDWQTALVPYYLKHHYAEDEFFKNTHTLLTLHNVAYQGTADLSVAPEIDIDPDDAREGGLMEHRGKLNLLKGGILLADKLNTVSPTYAREVLSGPEFGYGLEEVLKQRQEDFTGILNGADYTDWNPATDKLITANYDADSLEEKVKNKQALCELLNLPFQTETPVVAMIARLVEQKGVDLLLEALDEMLKLGIQFVLLGVGDRQYEEALSKKAKKHAGKMAVVLRFDERMAHHIQAGADMLLMPSRYEPCGLTQLYAMKYGTVPVVRATGGLVDTVQPFNARTGKGTGFLFKPYKAGALVEALKGAVKIFSDRKSWQQLQRNGMAQDFSWDRSAETYLELYRQIAGT